MVTSTRFSVSVKLRVAVAAAATTGCGQLWRMHISSIKWTDSCFVGYKSADTCHMDAATRLPFGGLAHQRPLAFNFYTSTVATTRLVYSFYFKLMLQAQFRNMCCKRD